jgi:endo-1,4-beta-xylanase
MRDILTTHITEVAGHWKGQCYAWDVVNEALNEDGTYRETLFYKILGEEYIKLAFQVAAKADPNAKLYYNDYNLESPSPKSQAARRIVQMLQKDGIKVDGVGMQAHFQAHAAPTVQQQIDVMKSYIEDGVEVALTELDVRIDLPVNETNLAQQKAVYTSVSTHIGSMPTSVVVTP